MNASRYEEVCLPAFPNHELACEQIAKPPSKTADVLLDRIGFEVDVENCVRKAVKVGNVLARENNELRISQYYDLTCGHQPHADPSFCCPATGDSAFQSQAATAIIDMCAKYAG